LDVIIQLHRELDDNSQGQPIMDFVQTQIKKNLPKLVGAVLDSTPQLLEYSLEI
jgi:hypothetical protein